jgi:uncharacterized Fe-S cluster protein YjdI
MGTFATRLENTAGATEGCVKGHWRILHNGKKIWVKPHRTTIYPSKKTLMEKGGK